MAGTGIGLPDADSFATYGGAIANYPIGVSDPTTEEDAALRNIYVANIAGMTHTVDRAMRSFFVPTVGQVGITDATGVAFDAVWGTDTSLNAKAVGTFISGGVIDVIWPTQVTDALGQVHTLSFKRAHATISSSKTATFMYASAKVTAGNRVRVYTYDSSLIVTDFSGGGQDMSITLWVR